MDDNSGDGNGADSGLDANSITSISNLHVKSLSDLARLSDHLPISWPELPRVPFFGPLLGFNDQWYRAAIALSVLETRWRGNRSLTPEEVQVVAGQTAKAVVTMSYEVPALFGTTWLYERRGRATFRFPFIQPGSSFDPNVFPSARWSALQGTAARSMWHLTRVALYTSLSHFALRTLFISYAMAVKNVEFERDPRLSSLRAAIRQHMTDRLANREQQQHPGHHGSPGLPLPPPDHSASAHAPPVRPHEQPSDGNSGEYGSGAGGYYDDGSPDALPQRRADNNIVRPQQQPPPLPWQPSRQWPSSPGPVAAQSSDDLSDDLDGFAAETHDEASPVAPTTRRRSWQRETRVDGGDGDGSSSGGGGSAWDRVRNQAASGEPRPAPVAHSWGGSRRGPPAPPQSPADSQQAAEDDRFSEFSVKKPTERENEQKEFDAMLERERQGAADDERTGR